MKMSSLRINLNKTITPHKSVHINTHLSCVALYTVYFLGLAHNLPVFIPTTSGAASQPHTEDSFPQGILRLPTHLPTS